MDNKKLLCNSCSADMEYTEQNDTHIWSCTDCPLITFEFVGDYDYRNLGKYLEIIKGGDENA